jgi:gamma-glutamyltranspeptidase/glutathione hydrolase
LSNLPPPTQGCASLSILAQVAARKTELTTEADWTHCIVEATKQAFVARDEQLADPNTCLDKVRQTLTPAHIQSLADNIQLATAKPWPKPAEHGDTVWLGACDQYGTMVSFIQSVYWEFGSGVVIEGCGFVWNNRGLGFSNDPAHPNCLAPNKKPKHTLNPAAARFKDGRRMVYGTMGGEGQPQTQAALFTRYAWQGYSLAEAISRGRWLLGRTWGMASDDLKVEQQLATAIGDELSQRGHRWHPVPQHLELMGHAGAIVLYGDGRIEAASDPRSDGKAITQTEDEQANDK